MAPKLSLQTRVLGLWLALLLPLTTAPVSLTAATYYWDSDATAAGDNPVLGTGLGGTGNWDTASLLWYNSLTNADVAWPNSAADAAIFTGTAGAVTLAAGGVNAGSLQVLTTGYSLSGGALTLGGAGSNVFVGSGVTATINSAIAGTNGLGVYGPGTLNLTGANSYSGSTNVNNGATLNLNFATNATDIISSGSPLVLNSGTLTLTGASGATNSQTFASTSIAGGSIVTMTQNGATSLTANLGTITQTVGGTLNLSVVPTAGVLVANTTSSNDASGILGPWATVGTGTATRYATVSSGTISAYSGATAATANLANVTSATTNYSFVGAATLAGARTANTLHFTTDTATRIIALGTNTLTLNGILNTSGQVYTISGAGTIAIGSNNELVISGSNSVTISSAITGAGKNLTYNGTGGALTLNTTASTFTGTTTVNSGTMTLALANVLNSASSLVVNGGTIGQTTFAQSLAAVTLKNGTINGTTGLLTSAAAFDLQSGTVSAAMAGTNGLNKTTPGTVTLSQTTAGTLAGNINVKAGTLILGGTAVPFAAANTINLGDSTGSADARLAVSNTNATYVNPIVLSSGTTGNLSIGNQGTTAIAFNNATTVSGTNNLIIANTSTGGLTLANVANVGTVTNGGSGAGVTTISALGAGVTALNQIGTSPLTLTPAWLVTQFGSTVTNSGAGLFTLNGGITGGTDLVFNAKSTGGITVASTSNTGTITNSGTGTGTTTITSVGASVTGISQTGTSPLTIVNAVTTAQLGGGSTITNAGAGLFTLTGGISSALTNPVFNANSTGGITVTAAMTASGTITNSGAGTGNVTLTAAIPATITDVTQNSPGTLTLTSAANAYTGTTTVTQGTLSFAGTPATGATSGLGNSSTNIILGGASTLGILNYTGSAATMTRNFTINAGGGQINSTTATLTLTPGAAIDLTNGPVTFGGANNVTLGSATTTNLAFTGTNSITKTGAGTLTLSQIGQTQGFIASGTAIPINVQQGTLQATMSNAAVSTSLLGSGLITLTPGATINLTTGNTSVTTVTNALTIANATGIATISTASGAFTWNQAVTFAAGANTPTLKITNGNGTGSTWTMSGGFSGPGNIQLNPTNTGSAITLSTNAVNNTGTISNIGASTQTSTISAAIGSNVTSISQAGANPFTISGAISLNATNNTFNSTGTGLWTLSGGFGTAAQPLVFNANSSGNITVSTAAVNNAGTITNSGTGGGVTTISSNIGSNVTNVVENSANSQLVLSGTNSYTGTSSVTAGILDFTTTLAIPGYSTSPATAFGTFASPRITAAAGTTLVLPYGGTNSVTATDLANMFNGTYNVFSAGSSLGLDTTNASPNPAVLSSVLADPGGSIGVLNFTKSGTNALTVGSANTYTGWTAIVNGTLNASLIGNVGTSSGSLGAPNTVSNGTIRLGFGATTGVLSYTGSGETTDRVIGLTGITGGGGIDQSGTGLLKFTSNPTFTGIGTKTLTLSGSTTGTGELSGTIAGSFSNTGTASTTPFTIAKTGSGTWTLSGTGNTAATLAISGGILETGANGLTLGNAGSATIQGNGVSGASATINGKIILAGVGASGNGADVGSTVAGFTLNLNAVITGGPTNNIDFFSAGTTILTGANTYQGQTQINGLTLQVSSINNAAGTTFPTGSNLGIPSGTSAKGNSNATLELTSGVLKYVGTGETTDRPFDLLGTTTATTLDQSGTGLLKFTGTNTATGAGVKTMTLQGSTTGTGEISGPIVNNSGTNTTGITKAGTGTWTLSGVNTYTGLTTVNGGNLVLSQGTGGTGVLNNTGIVINNGGTLSPLAGTSGYFVGNTGTTTTGGRVTLNAGGTLNLADGTVNPFVLIQGATFAGNAATFAGGALNFDIGAASADQIDVRLNNATGTGQATSSGANAISISLATGTTSLTPATYTLINANAAGSTLNNNHFYLTSPNLNVGGTLYLLSLSGSTGTEELTVAVNSGAAVTPSSAFWNGTTNASWAYQPGGNGTATNWAAAATGLPDTFALPGNTTNVTLTTNAATNLSTTLDQNFTVNSLTFTGAGTANSAGATIASGTGTNSLTINAAALNGNAAGNGITVNASAGADVISANVILGASQTWTNNSTTNPLSLTGGVSGSGLTLTAAGAGFIQIGNGGTTGSIATDVALVTTGNLAFNRSNTITQGTDFASTISGTGGVTQNGLGILDLAGANTYTGNTTVARGTLNISGAGSLTGLPASSKLNINPTAGNTAVVNYTSSATSTLFAITGATVAGTASAYNQSNGLVVMTPNTTTGTQSVVGGNGAYGFYNITGGTLRDTTGTAGGSRFTVSNQGTASATNGAGAGVQTGVIYVSGTGYIDHTNAEWWLNYGLGEITVTDSGKIDHTGSNQPFALFMNHAAGVTGGGYGVLNLAGDNAQVVIGSSSLRFGNSTTAGQGEGQSGFVNLASGTLSVSANTSTSLPTNGGNNIYYNFAGGTLKALAALTQFTPTSNAAATVINTIYGPVNNNAGALVGAGAPSFNGGLTIDTNGFTVTVPTAMPLLGATGFRVTQTDLTVSGGSGYIGAPAVIFSKPASASGVPAAGYALMSGGSVVGIVITDPGVYGSGETPVITLVGGGATTAATVTSAALTTANTNTGGLTKVSAGTLAMSGAGNTFGGPVDIKGGLLTVTTLANGGVASTLGSSSNAASNLLLNGGILGYSGTVAGTTDRNFTFAASNSGLDASGTTAGTFTLTAANAMTVAPGLGAANFVLQGSGTAATGSGFLGTLIADGTGTTLSVIKNGTGTWNITNNANTYSGATTINAGILSVSTLGTAGTGGNPTSLGSSSNAAANLILSGGTLQYTGSGATTDRNYTLGNATTAAGGGIDTTGATGPLVVAGNMTAVNTATGTQVLTLTSLAASGANSVTGSISDSSGTALTGVTKAGAGAWTLAGTNAYSGATTVNAGTLNITGTNSLASPITMTTGGAGVLNINSTGVVNAGTVSWAGATAGTINLIGGTLLVSGGSTLTSASATGNALSFNGGTLRGTGPLTISGFLPINIQAGGGTFDTSGGNITSSSGISNTASPGALNVIGGNTLQSAVNATQTGPVNITGTGTTLKLTNSAVYTNVWTVGTGANLDLNNVASPSVAGLAGGGTVLNTGASALRTLTITGTGGSTFSGSIQQPTPSTTLATGVTLNLSNAAATQTFSGANTYGGPTTITQGKLALSGGSLGNTAITVAASGTLAPLGASYTAGTTGVGTLGASLTINAGGTLSMVDGQIGTFNLNQNDSFATAGLTLTNGILNLELSNTGIDQLLVTGGVISSAISGTNTINITGLGTSLTPGTYTLVTAPGIAAGNTLFRFSNGTATDSIVVGPSTYTLTLAGIAGMEQLTVGAAITNMTWTGQTDGTGAANSVWTATPALNNNFATSVPAAADYVEGAAITFQDLNVITAANVTNGTVTIDAAGVKPGAVTVNNSAVNYTFQNAGGSVGIADVTSVSKSGTGTLTLLGQNSYTGGTELNGGIVNLGVAEGTGVGPLGNGGVISFSGGTLQYSAANSFDYSPRFSTAAGNLISIDTNGQNVTFATALTSPGGTLAKSGTGTLTLGSNVNTYSGATVVNGGTLKLTGNNGASGVIQSPTVTVNSGATLETTATDALGSTAGRNVLTINGGTVLNNTTGTRISLPNTVTMTGGFLAGSSLGDGNSGAFSLSGGTSVIATSDASGNPATISANISTQAVIVFQVNRGTGSVAPGAPDLLISGPITPYGAAGTNGVTYRGSGITNVTGANTYKGNTTILGGTLGGIVNANSTQALSNNLAGLIMGDNTGNYGVLNVNENNSITTLAVNTSNSTPGQNINTINIAAGKTLTNTGAVTIGVGTTTTNYANLTVTGDTWRIGTPTTATNANVQLGVNATTNISNSATLDLTGLSTFYANLGSGSFNVGETVNAGGTGTAGSTLKLAPTSTILATTISTDSPDGNVTQAIKLGTTTNVLQANTINIGGVANRAVATLDFLSGTGTVQIRNLAGSGGAAMNVAAGGTATGFSPAGTVDFTGHNADVSFSTLAVAGRSAGTSGAITGTFKFDTGTLLATTVSLASRSGSTITSGPVTGELDLMQTGGTTGTATIGTLNMGTNSATTATSSGAAIATLNIGGSGTVGITTWNMGVLSTTPGATAQVAGGPLQVTANISGSTTTVGTLTMNANSSTGTGTNKTSTATLNISGGTVNVGSGGISMANASTANASATTTINVTGSGSLTLSGDLTRAGGPGTETTNLNLNGATALLDMSGGGVVHNIGSSTAAINNFTFTDGTLQNIGTVYGGITLAGTGSRLFNETGSFSGQVNGVISGSGIGLNKTGTGTLTLLGANTFSGNVDIVGTLIANRSNNTVNPTSSALGNPQVARNINVKSGGTLQFSSSDTLGGSTSTVAATLVVDAGGTVNEDPSGWFNTLGPVQLNGGTLTGTKGASAQTQMYSLQGTVTVGGSAASTISGPGAGGSTFGGYHLAANTTFNVADATGTSASDLNVSGTLIDRPNSLGAGGLTKTGAGTMTLSAANNYTGATSVQNGTLQIGVASTGSTASGSAVTVNGASAALAGTGTVGGAATVTSGAIRPGDLSGDSVGTLLFGSTLSIGNAGKIELGLSSSSSSDPSFNWWANDALTYLTIPGNYNSTWSTIGTGYDALDVSGALTLGASTVINASSIVGTYNTGDIFKLLDWSGVGTVNSLSNGSTSFFNTANLVLPTLSSGQTWDTSAFTTFGVVVVVPEPSRALLGLTALVVLGLRRRRSV